MSFKTYRICSCVPWSNWSITGIAQVECSGVCKYTPTERQQKRTIMKISNTFVGLRCLKN